MAGPLTWEEVLDVQRGELDSLRSTLLACVAQNALRGETRSRRFEEVFAADVQQRHPRIHMISGERGSGKTSLLLTLIADWRRVKLDDGKPLVFRGWDAALKQVFFVQGLDFDPIPANLPLYGWLILSLLDVVQGLEEPSDHCESHRERSWESRTAPRGTGLLARWQGVFHTALGGWSARGGGIKSSTLEDQVLAEATQAKKWRRLQRDWRALVDAIMERLASRGTLQRDGLLVVPVDDVDMRATGTRDLLMAMRTLWHPNVLFVVTGELRQLENVLAVEMAREMGAGNAQGIMRLTRWMPNPKVGDAQRKFWGHPADLAESQVSKAIPGYMRSSLSLMTLEQALDTKMWISGGLKTLRERLAGVGLPGFAEKLTEYTSMTGHPALPVRTWSGVHGLLARHAARVESGDFAKVPTELEKAKWVVIEAIVQLVDNRASALMLRDDVLVRMESKGPFGPEPALCKVVFLAKAGDGGVETQAGPWTLALWDHRNSVKLETDPRRFLGLSASPFVSWDGEGGQGAWLQMTMSRLSGVREFWMTLNAELGQAEYNLEAFAKSWLKVAIHPTGGIAGLPDAVHNELALFLSSPHSGLSVHVRNSLFLDNDLHSRSELVLDSDQLKAVGLFLQAGDERGLYERRQRYKSAGHAWWWWQDLGNEMARSRTGKGESVGLGSMLEFRSPETGNKNRGHLALSVALSRYFMVSSRGVFTTRFIFRDGPGFRAQNLQSFWSALADRVATGSVPKGGGLATETLDHVLQSFTSDALKPGWPAMEELDWSAVLQSDGDTVVDWPTIDRTYPDFEEGAIGPAERAYLRSACAHFVAGYHGVLAETGDLRAQRLGLSWHVEKTGSTPMWEALPEGFPFPPLLAATQVWRFLAIARTVKEIADEALVSDVLRFRWVACQLVSSALRLRDGDAAAEQSWHGGVGSDLSRELAKFSNQVQSESVFGWQNPPVHKKIVDDARRGWMLWAHKVDELFVKRSGSPERGGWNTLDRAIQVTLLRFINERDLQGLRAVGADLPWDELVRFREEHGKFSNVHDIKMVDGVDRNGVSNLFHRLKSGGWSNFDEQYVRFLPSEDPT